MSFDANFRVSHDAMWDDEMAKTGQVLFQNVGATKNTRASAPLGHELSWECYVGALRAGGGMPERNKETRKLGQQEPTETI